MHEGEGGVSVVSGHEMQFAPAKRVGEWKVQKSGGFRASGRVAGKSRGSLAVRVGG